MGAPGREASILRSKARASRDHAPRFLGSGNAGKARQRIQYLAPAGPRQGFWSRPAHIDCINATRIRQEWGQPAITPPTATPDTSPGTVPPLSFPTVSPTRSLNTTFPLSPAPMSGPPGTTPPLPSPAVPHAHPCQCNLCLSDRAFARRSRIPGGAKCTPATGPMHPLPRNAPWTQSACRNGVEIGLLPPFQLRMLCRPPVLSKSRFLYTSMTPRRPLKFPCLQRGGALTPV